MEKPTLVAVDDLDWNGQSIMSIVVGHDRTVFDPAGTPYTTPANASLVRQAKSMLARRREIPPDALRIGLWHLARQAEPLPGRSPDGEEAGRRGRPSTADPFDHSRLAGALE